MERPNDASWAQVRRVFPLLAGILIAVSILLPLWSVSMRAPQYPGQDLYIYVHASRMTGDIFEFDTLNQYIGVRFPTDLPELALLPYFLGFLAVLSIVSAFYRGRGNVVITALMILFVLFAVLGAVDLQWRLYLVGHDLAPNPPIKGVGTFTPPLLGPNKVGNFRTFSNFRIGGWMIVLAFVLDLIAFRKRRETITVSELPSDLRKALTRRRKGIP